MNTPDLKSAILARVTMGHIARTMDIDISTVSRWFSRGRIPAERVIALEAITGVSRHVLRPDIYPYQKHRA